MTMQRFFRFNRTYFLLTLLLFAIEALIALYVHDNFIRPYIGDVLVVILIYCFVRAFFDTPVLQTASGVLGFSFIVEGSQYIKLVNIVGLQDSPVAVTIMGNSFAWADILAYIGGILLILFIEMIILKEIRNRLQNWQPCNR